MRMGGWPMMVGVLWIAVAGATAQAPVDYKRDVAPIFREFCVGCHGSIEANAGFSLETFKELLKGGENGPVIVPGKSGESRIHQVLVGAAEPKMPPEGSAAPPTGAIDMIRRWIDEGAAAPSDVDERIVADPVTPTIPPKTPPRGRLFSAAWSPDGRWIAWGSYQRVWIVESATGQIERTLDGHLGAVTGVAYAPDGKTLYAGSGIAGVRGEVVAWSVDDGSRQSTEAVHADMIDAVCVSPDGHWLATASYDKSVRLRSRMNSDVAHILRGHNEAVTDLAFRPDGNVLASVSLDRTLKLWNVATGERLDTLSESTKELYSVAFAPDGGAVYAAGADHRIRRWLVSADAREGTNRLVESRFAHEATIHRIAIRPDGALLATGAAESPLKLWQLPALSERGATADRPGWLAILAYSPDGKQLLVGSLNGSAMVVDGDSGARLRDLVPTPKPPPAPVLAAQVPAAVTIGSTTRVELTGQHLRQVTAIHLSHPGLQASVAEETPAGDRLGVNLVVASDVQRGRYELRLVTAGGQTEALPVYVDDLPTAVETSSAPYTPMALPVVAWGRLEQAGDADRFTFSAKAGETLVFDAASISLGFAGNLVLQIRDADGRVLASNNDFVAQTDPLLVWTAPADGSYQVDVHDLAFAGSEKHVYQLTAGAIPLVLGIHPMTVPAGAPARVTLLGPHVPPETVVELPANPPGEVTVEIPASYRSRRSFSVTVSPAASIEAEPNDLPTQATRWTLPSDMAGRIDRPGDVDHFVIDAKRGEEWILETDARRRGSGVDTRLDILTMDGRAVDRVWMAAVRDSYVEFRNIDSNQLEIRCKNWEEMELNQFMYMNGEVGRLFRHPRGPDSGFLFYSVGGQRRTYFDTNSSAHALEDSVYIVEPIAVGSTTVSNGLPTFKIPYMNDDASDRRLGADSKMTFVAPADGAYVVRVVDVRGHGDASYTYRLIGRPPAPDFRVNPSTLEPGTHRGSGREVTFVADRTDGFEGAIDITVENMPAGLTISHPIRIEAGHESTSTVLTAASDVAVPSEDQIKQIRIRAVSTLNGATVTRDVPAYTKIHLADNPSITVSVEPVEITIAPGATVPARLKIVRHGHKDRVTFEMPGLPHGVIVDNIGLNGILIPPEETEREFFLTARPFVEETDRPFFARANEVDAQASPPILLHVRRPKQVAEAPK
jgi:WD40 repeat protein